jgi:hypothetical protein
MSVTAEIGPQKPARRRRMQRAPTLANLGDLDGRTRQAKRTRELAKALATALGTPFTPQTQAAVERAAACLMHELAPWLRPARPSATVACDRRSS